MLFIVSRVLTVPKYGTQLRMKERDGSSPEISYRMISAFVKMQNS